jgi:nitroreductase
MIRKFDERANAALDDIILARRTNRAFAKEPPPRAAIEQIIHAGLWAPYAALAVAGRADFRRFFVFSQGTQPMADAARLMQLRARSFLESMKPKDGAGTAGSGAAPAYLERIKGLAENGHPSLKAAPYFVVLAEYQGIPASGLQSLAHAFENMWLKATALGLAFQLISITERMAEDKAFVELLGLPFGSYVLDGCAIGYPAAAPPDAKRIDAGAVTKWL